MATAADEFGLLMERVRNGCPDAARILFEEYGEHIRRVVRQRLHERLRSQFDSLDFAQDVWASFFGASPDQYTFSSPGELVSFLCRVARNKVTEAFRKGFESQKGNLATVHGLERGAGVDPIDPPHPDPTPSQFAVANERWQQLVEGQSETHRSLLELLRDGHSIKDAAERLDVHPRTLMRLLKRLDDQRQDRP
jgi:RNA polymerase sigma-70 factor (ECF subfamily)